MRDPDLVPLGIVVRSFREQAGFSQESLAHALEWDRGFVGGVERGERSVTFRKLVALLHFLGIKWEEFGRELDKLEGRQAQLVKDAERHPLIAYRLKRQAATKSATGRESGRDSKHVSH